MIKKILIALLINLAMMGGALADVASQFGGRGDRIENRLDQRADKAQQAGKYKKAQRLERKGDRVNRHLDKKGKRVKKKHR